ncbi:MAG: hypothetical protein ACI9Z9_002684 [Litorivivens sp.]|jgi:hypothetical protein
MSAENTLQTLIDRNETITVHELHAVYDALPVVDCEFMLGDWRGGCFSTGHKGEKMLAKLGWAGKRFAALNDVNPIMSLDDDGCLQVNPIMGTASLRRVEYRGQVTATMVYDQHPIFDHFKKFSQNQVLGVMDSKGDDFPLYFYLKRAN